MAALYWSSREERPHVQGKRNPSKTAGHQRADTLKPKSQKTSMPVASTAVPTHDKAMWESSGGQGEPEFEGCPSGPA